MGHNIRMTTYPEDVDKKAVQAEWDEYASHEDWQEGCSGLAQPIRWESPICESYEEAEKYIEAHDRGWYDQLAVRYRDVDRSVKHTKTYEVKAERAGRLRARYNEVQYAIHYAGVKSKFISCRSCESKIASTYIRSNNCPVCGKDLRPESALAIIANAKKAAEKAEKEFAEEVAKEKKKSSVIRWLVKIEYHT